MPIDRRRDEILRISPSALVPHIYASVNWVSIGSDNDLPPIRRQAIIKPSGGLLSITPIRTNVSEIWIKAKIYWRKCILKRCLQNDGHFV